MRRLLSWFPLSRLAGPSRLAAWRLSGPARCGGGELSALYLGSDESLGFFCRTLLAAAEHTRVQTASVAAGRVAAAARAAQGQYDLVLTEQSPLWARLAPVDASLAIPAWIRQQLSLPDAAPPGGPGLFPRALEKEVRRLCARHDYRLELGGDEDLAHFYHRLYRPHLRARFGDDAVVVDERTFRRAAAGQRLARLHAGGRWVAGMLLKRRGVTLRLGWYGALPEAAAVGASEVLDALCIAQAHARGVRRVVLGNSRPCLTDGVVRYKRRFGATIVATRFPQNVLGVSVRRATPALCRVLQQHPLIGIASGRACIARLQPEGTFPRLALVPLDAAAGA